jgi:hypothetical protein
MHDMMDGGMNWGTGLGIVVLVLVVAALLKYVFFR